MDNIDLRKFPDADSLARAAAQDWLAWLGESQKRKAGQDRIRVALSGGRITKEFFMRVGELGSKPELYENVHFFWADERCVPPTDPESNYAMAKDLLFGPLKIPDANIHRLRGEDAEAVALGEAAAAISEGAPLANGQPVLDLIHLGMGEDGHTASLFPGESSADINNPAIYRAVTAVKPPPRRFTLGYGVLAAAREVWVLASGQGKESALRQTLLPAGRTPLARVIQMRTQTRVYTDVA